MTKCPSLKENSKEHHDIHVHVLRSGNLARVGSISFNSILHLHDGCNGEDLWFPQPLLVSILWV